MLFGIHLSGDESLKIHENIFLERAIQSTHADQRPQNILYNIQVGSPTSFYEFTPMLLRFQADILLAHYYLCLGKFMKAMHRFNSAMSLVIACGLHEQGHVGGSLALYPPQDPIEAGQHTDVFWTILNLHKCWGVALEWPSPIYYIMNENVDIPWPLEMSAYESVRDTVIQK
jgi:hypothetical protein